MKKVMQFLNLEKGGQKEMFFRRRHHLDRIVISEDVSI